MGSGDAAKYVKRQKNGIYRYYRRVPVEVAHVDRRQFVKTSLKTRSLKEAIDRAEAMNRATERLWAALAVGSASKTDWNRHTAAVKLAQSLGFAYKTNAEIAAGPIEDVDARLTVAEATPATEVSEAVAGLAPEPNPLISDVWTLYEEHNRAALIGMSPKQIKKHRVSRQRALAYLQDLLGNVHLKDIDRAAALRFRGWWVDKITAEGLRAYSANRSFSDISGMLTVIDSALQTHFHAAWEKIRIAETNATKLRKRPPFPSDWVQNKILEPGALDSLNLQARLIVYIMAETGMRLSEVCNLRRSDIRLGDAIPHVEVAERDDRRQKTDYSIRRIPLVGVALWAMKQAPEGFPRYADNEDSASAAINKQMDELGLRPTPRHTVYSLRHTFQDRILAAGAPDRMQADLMGHEFGRPSYGDGAAMVQRQALLESIKFRWQE